MLEGIITKAISSFYSVDTEEGVFICKASWLFKNKKQSLLVGDKVNIVIADNVAKEGIIEKIIPRTNILIRPSIANVSHALLFFSIKNPDPNLSLIDRFIVLAQEQQLKITLCFSKVDLDDGTRLRKLLEIYKKVGYPVISISTYDNKNLEELKNTLKSHITVIAGPSGAGKSSFINTLSQNFNIKTNSVSNKIGRGRHTTRHVELMRIGTDSWIADTPGFSSLSLSHIPYTELKEYFLEFHDYDLNCKFSNTCLHYKEPDCCVINAVKNKEISLERYQSYLQLLEEIKETERRKSW